MADRPGRSWYLDDMDLQQGDTVLCKEALASPGITPGRRYDVETRDYGSTGKVLGIINDNGRWVIPSARFQKVEN